MGAASVIGFSDSDKEPAGTPVAALAGCCGGRWRSIALEPADPVAVVPTVLLVGGDLSWWFWVIAIVFLRRAVHVGQGLALHCGGSTHRTERPSGRRHHRW